MCDGAELNTVPAEGGGTFPLDPDLEAKCDFTAVTTRSRCATEQRCAFLSAEVPLIFRIPGRL